MKLSEAIELLEKLNKCWDGCPPDATECKKCPFFVDDASGKEAIKTALIYLASIKEKEPEQKKGEWIKNDNGTYSCSICHSWIPEEQHHYARYCLHCGIKMTERKDLQPAQPESTRIFVGLVARYPDPLTCTYMEYVGKPYYSIKYIENGETHVGYSTYSLEVLSRYLKEYFMLPTGPEIIRCKECEFWAKQQDSLQGRCALMGAYPTGNWFCGNAKRREHNE